MKKSIVYIFYLTANIQHFFESTKFAKQILQILLQNKSNKANWTNEANV